MCLAVPALITGIRETLAEADLGGVTTLVSLLFTPEAKVGDYVVMHAGYAISVLDPQEAEATLELLRYMAQADAVE